MKWAIVSVEWIRFDNEENHTADSQGGTHPYGTHDHKIHYCYYKGKRFLFIMKMILMSTASRNVYPHGAGIWNHTNHYCYYQGKWFSFALRMRKL